MGRSEAAFDVTAPAARADAARAPWLSRERLVLYSAALLLLQAALIVIWAVAYWVLHVRGVPLPGSDFRVFWCASDVTLRGGAAAVFDQQRLGACEAALQAGTPLAGMFGPWIYPPTFLTLVQPLALLPYAVSYAAFVAISAVVCLIAGVPAMKRNPLPWVTVAAFPGISVAAIYGQNSLLTLGLAAGALGLLESSPIWAGICAGALVIKPQFAILFPLFFLCGRHFRACAAAIATATAFCAVSTLLFGWSLWISFLRAAAWFQDAALAHGDGRLWHAMPTLYAFAREMGAGAEAAYALHAGVAFIALLATSIAWACRSNYARCAAAAILATLIVQPYLVYYDLAWLLLPIIYACREVCAPRGSIPGKRLECVAATLAWLAPIVSFLLIFRPAGPQWAAFLAPAWLALILARTLRGTAHH